MSETFTAINCFTDFTEPNRKEKMKTKKRLTGAYFTYFNSGAYFDIQSIEYQNIQTKKNLGHLYLVEN